MATNEETLELNRAFVQEYKELLKYETYRYAITVLSLTIVIVALLVFIFLAFFKPQTCTQEQFFDEQRQTQQVQTG